MSELNNGTNGLDHARDIYLDELQRLQKDPEHYSTPGARKYFRRVALGYIILAVGCMLGIKFVSDVAEQNVRDDINASARASCLASIPTLNKFNDLVDLQIESNRASRLLAAKEGDQARVNLTTRNIIRLQDNKLRVPNARECEAPILK